MFCTFVFTASSKADHCFRTKGLFKVGKWWWHSRCNQCPCRPPELTRPPVPKKTKFSSFQSTGGVIITQRADDSLKLQEGIEALLEEQYTSCNTSVQFGLYLPSWYHAYTTLFWSTFWKCHIDYFSSMCVGLTSSSCKEHSSSSHIIFLISSPLSLMTCSSNNSHYLHLNRSPSFSISRFTNPFQSSQSASPNSDMQCRISILWQLYPATYVQWPLPPLLLPLLQQLLVASSILQWSWLVL